MSKNILDETYTFLGRFVAYPSEEAHVANTLWIAHTHLMDEWQSTPRIAFLSAEPASGKSRALGITALLVREALKTENVSVPALFRSVKEFKPTVLLDEIDTVFGPKAKKDNEDLRGLLNAGYDRDGKVLRCEGNDHKVTPFPAYCAIAMAGLGSLHPTLLSRSIVIRMRKRKRGETLESYRKRPHESEGHALRDKIAKWAADQKGKLRDAIPKMPHGVEDRDADVWEPFLVIADAMGGEWPERARKACVTLVTDVTAFQRASGDSDGVRLLTDLLTIFGSEEKLLTSVIIDKLCALPESEWTTVINRNDRITPLYLSKRLRDYDIEPEQLRFVENGKDIQKRGYKRSSFVDVWERHCPLSTPAEPVTLVTPVTETKAAPTDQEAKREEYFARFPIWRECYYPEEVDERIEAMEKELA